MERSSAKATATGSRRQVHDELARKTWSTILRQAGLS